MPGPIRVAVIDDHPLFREGVTHTIERSGVLQVIAEGASASDAIRIAKAERPDIVLLDIAMPGGGVAAARTISQACPIVKIIMLTVSESEDHVHQSMEAGVCGYVLKGTSGLELINVLRAVARGECYVTPRLAARILVPSRRPSHAPPQEAGFPDLTKREEEILANVSRGLANKEIARVLQISDKTVKHYMTNIMQKLQVRNRVEAALVFQKKSPAGSDGISQG